VAVSFGGLGLFPRYWCFVLCRGFLVFLVFFVGGGGGGGPELRGNVP